MLESSFLSGLLAVSLQTPRAYSGDQGGLPPTAGAQPSDAVQGLATRERVRVQSTT